MKKILIVSTAPTQFKSLIQYAFILRHAFEVAFYFDDSQDNILNETEVANAHGFNYYFHVGSPYFKAYIQSGTPAFLPSAAESLLKKLFPGSAVVQALLNCSYQEHYAKRFLEFYKPDVILSAQDNFGIMPVLAKLAKNMKIKTVASVFTLANQQELGYVFSKLDNYIIKTFRQKATFLFYPRWKMVYKGIPTACEAPPMAVAKEWKGHAPRNPWISVGGRSDHAIMESEFVKDYYVRSGLDAGRVRMVPHPALQRFQELANDKGKCKLELKSKYPAINDLPVVLCSLPPDHFPNATFKDHKEIVTYWLSILTSQQTHQVWISLHPRQKAQDVSYLADHNVVVVKEPIETLMPLCDVFVAQYSATIRLALMCGKPVLNYDMFEAGYSEYNSCAEVATVSTKKGFEEGYKKLCNISLQPAKHDTGKAAYYGNFTSEPDKQILSFFDSL